MFRKSLGGFILYLISYAYALEVKQALQIPDPLLENNRTNVYDLEVEYTGHSDCESGHRLVTRHGDNIYIVNAANGARIYEPLTAHNDVAHHLSVKRQLPNPTIVSYTIDLVGGSTLTGSVTLATVAGASALAAAVLLLWYGATALYAKANEPANINSKRDDPMIIASYNDDTDTSHYDQAAVNSDEQMDMMAMEQCVALIESSDHGQSGGCCNIGLVGSGGYNYRSTVGLATVDQTSWIGCGFDWPTS